MTEQEQITKALENGFIAIFNRIQPGPSKDRLWDFNDIGHYLGVSTRTARDDITKRPDFPAKLKIMNSSGCQRWQPDDVIAWAKTFKVKK